VSSTPVEAIADRIDWQPGGRACRQQATVTLIQVEHLQVISTFAGLEDVRPVAAMRLGCFDHQRARAAELAVSRSRVTVVANHEPPLVRVWKKGGARGQCGSRTWLRCGACDRGRDWSRRRCRTRRALSLKRLSAQRAEKFSFACSCSVRTRRRSQWRCLTCRQLPGLPKPFDPAGDTDLAAG
jgi:hypothetical protein